MYESIDENEMDVEIREPDDHHIINETSSNESEVLGQRHSYQLCTSTVDKHQYNETNTHTADSSLSENDVICDTKSSDDNSSDNDGYLKPVITREI